MRDAEAQQSGFDPFDRLLLTSNVSLWQCSCGADILVRQRVMHSRLAPELADHADRNVRATQPSKRKQN